MERIAREERLQFAAAWRVPAWTQVSPTMQNDTRDSLTKQPSIEHTAKFRWSTHFFNSYLKLKVSIYSCGQNRVVYRLCDANT